MGAVLLQYSQQCIATDYCCLFNVSHQPALLVGVTEAVFKLTPGAQTQILMLTLMHSPQSTGFYLKLQTLHNQTLVFVY